MQAITNFAAANQYLRRFHDQSKTKYNLDNMRRLMAFLGDPQNKLRVVHVAGTSGKTSTAYYMAALLTAAGQKTGLTVSPHVDQMNERAQINGQLLSELVFCQYLTEFLEAIEMAPVKPSWFEAMVAFAYWLFAREKVDYAVVEVGLGGLKDGTNVVDRTDKICVITDIGFDHVKVLGNSLAEIAAQKAGIIHSGNVVFTYKQPSEVMEVLENDVLAQKAELHVVEAIDNPEPDVPEYQFRNGFLAYNTYRFLRERDHLPNLTDQALGKIRYLLIPGRMDTRQKNGKTVVMDGAHNAQKMRAFVDSFKKMYPGVRPAVLLAMRDGKDHESIAPILTELATRVVTTTFDTTQDLPIQSLPAEDLAKLFDKVPATAVPDQKAALNELLAGPEEFCVITGSLYLLGQLRNNGLV